MVRRPNQYFRCADVCVVFLFVRAEINVQGLMGHLCYHTVPYINPWPIWWHSSSGPSLEKNIEYRWIGEPVRLSRTYSVSHREQKPGPDSCISSIAMLGSVCCCDLMGSSLNFMYWYWAFFLPFPWNATVNTYRLLSRVFHSQKLVIARAANVWNSVHPLWKRAATYHRRRKVNQFTRHKWLVVIQVSAQVFIGNSCNLL